MQDSQNFLNDDLAIANIGILRMTGEVTDRFSGITLFGMALFWQKTIELYTEFIIHFLTYRVEHLFNSEFYCLLVSQISFRFSGIWMLGHRSMRNPTDQWLRIADGCLIDFSCESCKFSK